MPAAAVKRLPKFVELLAKRYEVEGRKGELTDLREPFLLGAWWLLGQHAKRNGQVRAFEALRRAKGLTPGQLLDLPPEKLAGICQIAGPYEDARMKTLQAFADDVEDKCGHDFAKVFEKPAAEVRAFLEQKLRTPRAFADFLLMYTGAPIFALDPQIVRVATRLGFVRVKTEKPFEKIYKDVQKALEAETPKNTDALLRAHGLLHRLGGDLCLPVPHCGQCPLLKECPFAKKHPEFCAAPTVFAYRQALAEPANLEVQSPKSKV